MRGWDTALFRRSDGVELEGVSLVRRIMPIVMPTRNESVVFHEMVLDLSRTLPFIEEWNRTHQDRLTLFHLALAAASRVMYARPGLNRFVSGGRIYQRSGCQVSFMVKQAFEDEAPMVTVKMDMPEGEPLEQLVRRVLERIGDGRSGRPTRVDKELRLAFLLPTFALRGAFRLVKALDRWNLLPASFTRPDPMFSSVFMANLGSVGVDGAFHHLFEYGTVSLFVVVGKIGPHVFIENDGTVTTRPGLRACLSVDERINDGHYCLAAIQLARSLIEDPAQLAAAWPTP
jgi:hypothetical protein